MRYLLDTSFFLTAYNTLYPPDVFIGFWRVIRECLLDGLAFSIDKVKLELDDCSGSPADTNKSNDQRELKDVTDWIKRLPCEIFLSTEEIYNQSYPTLVNWAKERERKGLCNIRARENFCKVNKADIYLIGYAMHRRNEEWTIVTEEVRCDEKSKKIKIPNVCDDFDIQCCNTIEMLRRLNLKI